jgi:uncharacterized damage-inducible protein DinB
VTAEQWDAPDDYSRGSLHEVVFHILMVEEGWLYPCQHGGRGTDLPDIDQFPTPDSLRPYADQQLATQKGFIENADEEALRRSIVARNAAGEEYTMIVWQILTHVLYHSAQHRSEAAALLTAYGQSPGDLDFLFFV